MNWHADSALLSRYAAGKIDEAGAASVEAHLLECERCRAGVGQQVDELGSKASGRASIRN